MPLLLIMQQVQTKRSLPGFGMIKFLSVYGAKDSKPHCHTVCYTLHTVKVLCTPCNAKQNDFKLLVDFNIHFY